MTKRHTEEDEIRAAIVSSAIIEQFGEDAAAVAEQQIALAEGEMRAVWIAIRATLP